MGEENWMELMAKTKVKEELLATNGCTKEYGLTLSEEDAALLAEERQSTLRAERRIELGGSVLPQIVQAFCDSEYIKQENYVEVLGRLQEIFFAYKNEMQDEITDEELINFMREQYENVCFGDLDYLEGTCLNLFAQAIRAGYRGYEETDGRGQYAQFDEVVRWDPELYQMALSQLFG
ncbi:MAG: DUF6323 family protein [Roseburia sp.]